MILPERVFGRASAKRMSSGLAMAPICSPTHSRSSFASAGGIAVGPRAAADDEGEHRLALDLVRAADHRGLGDARMRDQRALDLHRAEAVAGDVQHVVDAAHDPEVAVLVAARAVAGEVEAVLEVLPVGAQVALVVAPDRAQHRRPGLADDELAARVGPLTSLPSSSTMSASMPGSGSVQEPGLVGVAPGSGVIMIAPVSVCHQVSTIGQRSSPMTR